MNELNEARSEKRRLQTVLDESDPKHHNALEDLNEKMKREAHKDKCAYEAEAEEEKIGKFLCDFNGIWDGWKFTTVRMQ